MLYNMNMEIDGIVSIMQQLYGQDVSSFDAPFLISTMAKRFEINGLKHIDEYALLLTHNKTEADAFHRDINNTFSQFFRELLTFEILSRRLMPLLLQQKNNGEFRIWSAGCSTGQEAYSIAMMIEELTAACDPKPRYRIIATDRSEAALQTASRGTYNQHEVQNLKVGQLQKFFHEKEKEYIVLPRLKDKITFARYDLLDPTTTSPSESVFGDFDLIFCCNLLLYYKPEAQQFMLRKLIKSLSRQGFLVTGEAEKAIMTKATKLTKTDLHAAIFQLR